MTLIFHTPLRLRQQTGYPEAAQIVQKGIDKLITYRERVEHVPAYTLSMLVNPAIKLSWFEKYKPDKVADVRNMFIRELERYHTDLQNTPARPSGSNWADEILGMESPQRPAHRRSIEDEVRGYFAEAPYTLGSVQYWQENQLRHPTIFALAVD
ncbi:hypothetical protein R3P38DRAFT_3204215 [Favolaschia claudopus]|uniref:Uncharacterized protein n=1 Tax=Favolaschia claudopus TaxID=2862362 RepID=A0AAW0ARG2_9AGAR